MKYWKKKKQKNTFKVAYPGARQKNTILLLYGVKLTINNNSSKKLVCILQLWYMYVPIITKVVKCSCTNNLYFLISKRSWLTLHLFLDPSHTHQHTYNSLDYEDHKCVPLQMSQHVQSHCALSNSVVIVTRTQKHMTLHYNDDTFCYIQFNKDQEFDIMQLEQEVIRS